MNNLLNDLREMTHHQLLFYTARLKAYTDAIEDGKITESQIKGWKLLLNN